MSFSRFDNVRVAGVAACVPKKTRKTISSSEKYDVNAFVETTGVEEKRISGDYTTSDLCYVAANQLMQQLGWDRSEIDALIFVSQTPDYILPATSCVLHGKMGLPKSCFTLDISLGCSGWVVGLNTIMALIESGNIKRGLLLCGDARGQVKSMGCAQDELFGFAGSATAIEYDKDNSSPIFFEIGTDGTGYDAIIRHYGGCRNQMSADDFIPYINEDGNLTNKFATMMKGMDVFAFGITSAPKSVKKLAKEYNLDYFNADYYIFHQANLKMLRQIEKKLKLDQSKVLYSINKFGNTSSASIPLTMVVNLSEDARNKKIICCGFGVGLSWGTVYFESDDNFVVSKLIEIGDE